MIQIEDVRGQCDILHEPILDSSASPEVRTKIERLNSPAGEAERRHRRWQRATMLVYKRICSHRYAQHFLRPVTDDIAPLYSTIVRRPMDLSTIKRRIKDGVIRTTAELTRALQLMFSNALMYNSSHHFIYQMTLEFREETLRELSVLASAEEGAGADSPLSRLLSRHAPPPVLAQRTSATHRHQELIKIAPASRIRRASIYHVEDSTEPRNTPISSTHRAPADPGVPEDSRRSTSVLGKRRASVYQSADPKPPRSRRTSMYHPADPEVPEDSRRSTSVLGKRRASVYQSADPKPTRSRRTSMYHPADPEVPEDSRRSTSVLRKRRASVYHSADPKPTRARRASMYHPSDSEVPEDSRRSTSVLGKRRASVYQPADPKPAPRARRASMYHPADPETKEAKKRTKWDWPSIEDEHLIPKKYKNCVVVL
ncbi:bromodomain-containing protein 4A [Leguminivora glycinivorella]|uniref:bromodomain-containing protein 4A n=1 Tax=Leguminivora glycinivorella TaxID=1035111 RepID=UPI0020107B16|nr:bromodomain-containing protein 4A [Leguminivora glycinivorella]